MIRAHGRRFVARFVPGTRLAGGGRAGPLGAYARAMPEMAAARRELLFRDAAEGQIPHWQNGRQAASQVRSMPAHVEIRGTELDPGESGRLAYHAATDEQEPAAAARSAAHVGPVSDAELERMRRAGPMPQVADVGSRRTLQPGGDDPRNAAMAVRSLGRAVVPGVDYATAGANWLGERIPSFTTNAVPADKRASFAQHLAEARFWNERASQRVPSMQVAGGLALTSRFPWSKAAGIPGALARIGQVAGMDTAFALGEGRSPEEFVPEVGHTAKEIIAIEAAMPWLGHLARALPGGWRTLAHSGLLRSGPQRKAKGGRVRAPRRRSTS